MLTNKDLQKIRQIIREEITTALRSHVRRYKSVEEAARYMGIRKTLAYDLIKTGKLSAGSWKGNGCLKVDVKDIDTYHMKQKALQKLGRMRAKNRLKSNNKPHSPTGGK